MSKMQDRTVASMTAVQIYRKRASDRDSQRECRAQKKTKIKELENEIKRLNQELDAARAEINVLQTKDAEVQKSVESVLEACTNLTRAISRDSMDHVAEDMGEISQSSPSNSKSRSQAQQLATGNNEPSPEFCIPDLQSAFAYPFQYDLENLEIVQRDDGLSFSLPLSGWLNDGMQLQDNSFDISHEVPLSLSLPDPQLQDYYLLQEELPAAGRSRSPESSHQPAIWERLPPHVEASSRIESVLLNLTRAGQQHAQNIGDIEELSGPTFPSVASLLNPERENSNQPVSCAIGNHAQITMQLPRMPERFAMMYIMCNIVRWLVAPSKRTYEAMPEYLRPTELQLTVPHPIWVDILPWPNVREVIIQEMNWADFELFRVVTSRGLSVNWLHDDAEIYIASRNGQLRLNPIFEQHIRDARNYTWSPEYD